MTKLTTAAWVAHELGLASSLGGLLFGKLALNPDGHRDRHLVGRPLLDLGPLRTR
jgi:hypothetical protein